MLTLYDYLPSQNGWKIRQLLAHLDLPYRSEFVAIFDGEGQSADYRRISPTGTVPALRLADGRTLAESNAILAFLAEGTPYLPGGTLRHWRLTGKLARRPPALVAMKRDAAVHALAILDSELETRAFVARDAYTIADIALYAYAAHAQEAGIALRPFVHFNRWLARVRAQPGHLATTHAYALDPHSSRELAHRPLPAEVAFMQADDAGGAGAD
jgi:glutathione S-transferase